MVGGREENALVLDFLPFGLSSEAHGESVAQLIGETNFTLLEVVVKSGVKLNAGDRVYIGKGVRDKIDHIKRRVKYCELTNNAQNNAKKIIKDLVLTHEKQFVVFFNAAGPINIRAHSLEHIPSVGKKHLQAILDAREKKPFENFADLQARVPHLMKIEELLAERIIHELNADAKYYLFTKPPVVHDERDEYRDNEYRR